MFHVFLLSKLKMIFPKNKAPRQKSSAIAQLLVSLEYNEATIQAHQGNIHWSGILLYY